MSEVESTELSARLHDAVDDQPVTVPDLLTPARSRRRRRRVALGAGAVAVILAGAVTVSQLLSVAPRTALVAATPSATAAASTTAAPVVTPSSAVLTSDMIVARCGPQMVKYDALPQFGRTTNTWQVAHTSHSYQTGDIVALLGLDHVYPAYCRIPAAGHEKDEVSFASLEPDNLSTTDRVAMCSESMSITLPWDHAQGTRPSSDFNTADVREATILATTSAGKMMMLLLAQGTTTYECELYPQPWDFGGPRMHRLDATTALWVGLEGSAAGAAGKSVVPGPATYYRGAGRLPANARTIEFTISKKRVATVTADANGWWVAAFMVDGRNSLSEPSTYVIKDAGGTVLKTGSVN